MNKLIVFLLVILVKISFGQNPDFTLGLILPEPSQKLNEELVSQLKSKLTNLINKSEFVAYGYNNDFVIFPIINVEETSSLQGGLENITVTKIDLTLNMKQISSNRSFNIISKKIVGSGKTEQLAIANGFSMIKATDKELLEFIKIGKENIFKYFNENCKGIENKAKNLFDKQDYVQAISLLQSIPELGNNCFEEAQKNAIVYYKGYQSKLCKENVIKAKSAIAIKNYENALYLLNEIDISSSCYSEVLKLINQISDKVEIAENKELDLEKRRMDAIKEIAKAYYSNCVSLVSYNFILQ